MSDSYSVENMPDFNCIGIEELTNISHYQYRMLRQYLNKSKDHPAYNHCKYNLLGEMYENLIYESLLKWAIATPGVSRFVLKGPYVDNVPNTGDGFLYNSNKQIFYDSNKETLSEFDALFEFHNQLCFVEITNMYMPDFVRPLEYEVLRKCNLLKLLFPDDSISCWVITSYAGEIKLKGLADFKILRTPQWNLDPDIIKNENYKLAVSASKNKFETVDQLKYQPFNYWTALDSLHRDLSDISPGQIKDRLSDLMSPYLGLMERYFLGKLSVSDFCTLLKRNGYPELDQNLKITDVYLAFKIKDFDSPVETIYLRGNDRYYEIVDPKDLKVTEIESRRRKTREIARLDKILKYLDQSQVEQFFENYLRLSSNLSGEGHLGIAD